LRDSAILLEVNSPGPVPCFWKQFPDHTQWSQNASVLLMVFFQSLFRPGNSCKSHCLFLFSSFSYANCFGSSSPSASFTTSFNKSYDCSQPKS